MNISWNWLLEYVDYKGDRDAALHRMTMSGLNVDAVDELPDGDALLDVEVASNRPDCLGHIGVARELAALTASRLVLPEVGYEEGPERVEDLTSVEVLDHKGCPRYTARVILGVKVGPSPRWLTRRLEAVGLRPINNVVDVTNFVMYEHGQPLHAFDYDLLGENRIVVRRARRGEAFTAIDHSQHRLEETDLVIADAERAVAIAGVMGGLDSEVNDRTVNVLLEAAMFDPLSVRGTSRAQQLMSDASYRFERGVDYTGVDWASRRACRLIREVAGGRIVRGVADTAVPPPEPRRLSLRFQQIPRILGIDVSADEAVRILEALEITILRRRSEGVEVSVPTFRGDLAREVDLVEEVARVYGFDKVPYLTHIPTVAPQRRRGEIVTGIVQSTLVAAGFQEAITMTLTDSASASLFSQGDASPPLATRGTIAASPTAVRKSVLSGLLQAKRANQDVGVAEVALFEIARAFRDAGSDRPPHESVRLALLADTPAEAGKGALEAVADRLGLEGRLTLAPASRIEELGEDGQADVCLDGRAIGFCGYLSAPSAERYKFRHVPWAAEVEMAPLVASALLVPRAKPLPQLPGIERDLALVVEEGVLWRDLERCVREAGVDELEEVSFLSLFRGRQVLEGCKCLAVRLRFRGRQATLTHEQADAFQDRILSALRTSLGAELRSGQA